MMVQDWLCEFQHGGDNAAWFMVMKMSTQLLEVRDVGKEEQKLPYLLYLQGGPGFECRQPTESSGWVQKVCEEFHLILMDQT
ncbi:hypothetical protein LR48_Vigan10g117300 [Vigna angularis]|uniref:AB hydrolase-1 domain-containing protein n=1 Tax=Phaseolus angularis TaxID=3914 RepID=A0A0L9VJQ3_PHAAN|nr:hypothetical protein LR48_Vigan10g117300 [Vigna angularis]